ncbi:hypothetical protein M0811_04790 [Anaeramoeba ignava]|uniref:BTB/POZ domain-containing protein n=1 Tax=Anaeramoeba ignava TaxID=1746090 RepID=A0A9Q0LV60_ANAIG|nr:hypothetical protein M0811_04790 [Anaeramoeba ignava]
MSLRFENKNKLIQDYSNLFQNHQFADFQVEIQMQNNKNSIFDCHKCILSSRSDYFKALFNSQMKESKEGKVLFSNVSPLIMNQILKYIYIGEIEISHENAIELLIESKKLLLDQQIIQTVTSFIKTNLTAENVVDIFHLATQFDLDEITKFSFDFILQNFLQIQNQNQQFFRLTEEDLISILSRNNFQFSSESDIFSSILLWIDFHSQTQNINPKNIFKCIRFCDMNHSELQKIQESNVIKNSFLHEIIQNILSKSAMDHTFQEKLKQKSVKSFQTRIQTPQNSTILLENQDYTKTLFDWIHDSQFFNTMQLGYLAKRDGFSPSKFHELCDNKGKTLVLFHTQENNIFGGFTSKGWVSDPNFWATKSLGSGWVKDPHSFIFSLQNSKSNSPQKFNIKPERNSYSVFYSPFHGPTFGDRDFAILSKTFQKNDPFDAFLSNFGYAYQVPFDLKDPKKFFSDPEKFTIDQIEVYFENQN